MTSIDRHRLLSLLLATALVMTLGVALRSSDSADAVTGPVEVVYVATGRDFPDALAGSTLAVASGGPLLTVEKGLPIPPATVTALEALEPNRIVIFGGAAAVSAPVAGALESYTRSGEVTRLSGSDRHATAAAIADALPDKVADADKLDGFDSTDFLTSTSTAADSEMLAGSPAGTYTVHRINISSDATIRSNSPGLDGATVTRPPGTPTGTYCLRFPTDSSIQRESAVGSVQDIQGGFQAWGMAVTTTRGHTCNGIGNWDVAVDITSSGAAADSDFNLLIPAS